MKKFTAIALSIVFCLSLALSLSSCEAKTLETFNGAEPQQLYSLALESLNNMDNFEIVHEQTITTSVFFIFKQSVDQTITVKIDGDDFYQNIECSDDSIWEDDAILESWYVDSYLYAYTDGAMRKQHFDPSEMEGSVYDFDNADGKLLNLPESWFKDSCFYAKGDDVYLEFIIDGEEYCNLLSESGGDTELAMSADGDVKYRVYFHDDGTVDRIESSYSFIVEESGIEVKATVEMVSTVKNVGSTSVDLPSSAPTATEGYWFYIH